MNKKIFGFLRNTKNAHKKEIETHIKQGWLTAELQRDKVLFGGLTQFILELEQAGFEYEQIAEIGSLGQIEADAAKLEEIKSDLLHNNFKGNLGPEAFNPGQDYINIDQIVLDNGKIYVVAESSPADYFRTYVGIAWKVKISKKIDIGKLPKTSLIYKKACEIG